MRNDEILFFRSPQIRISLSLRFGILHFDLIIKIHKVGIRDFKIQIQYNIQIFKVIHSNIQTEIFGFNNS